MSSKNHNLSSPEVQSKILSLANYLYFQNATSNFSLITDIIVEYLKRNKEFCEIAAVPRSTLYKFLTLNIRWMRDIKEKGENSNDTHR